MRACQNWKGPWALVLIYSGNLGLWGHVLHQDHWGNINTFERPGQYSLHAKAHYVQPAHCQLQYCVDGTYNM